VRGVGRFPVGALVTWYHVGGTVCYQPAIAAPFPERAAAVAILRYNLYEIDILIRRTLIYSALTTILALVYFGSVFVLQKIFCGLTGETSNVVVVLSTLIIAMLFTPLRARVQAVRDQRFYRRKYNAEAVLARFSERSRVEVDLSEISEDLLGVVEETFKPERESLWLRKMGQ